MCDTLNRAWFHFITSGRPHVTLEGRHHRRRQTGLGFRGFALDHLAAGARAGAPAPGATRPTPCSSAQGRSVGTTRGRPPGSRDAVAAAGGARRPALDEPQRQGLLAPSPGAVLHHVRWAPRPGGRLRAARGRVVTFRGRRGGYLLPVVMRARPSAGSSACSSRAGPRSHGQFIQLRALGSTGSLRGTKAPGSQALPWLDLPGGKRMTAGRPVGVVSRSRPSAATPCSSIRRDGLS